MLGVGFVLRVRVGGFGSNGVEDGGIGGGGPWWVGGLGGCRLGVPCLLVLGLGPSDDCLGTCSVLVKGLVFRARGAGFHSDGFNTPLYNYKPV